MKEIRGKKVKMSQVFKDDGKVLPVTVLTTENELDEGLVGKNVVVIGKSKGKGFTGVMKKWGFAGGDRTRGQSNTPRAAGSIGSQTPGRVFKGKKMAGRAGGSRVTVKGLQIVNVTPTTKEIVVSGPVPGARNARVIIKVIEK